MAQRQHVDLSRYFNMHKKIYGIELILRLTGYLLDLVDQHKGVRQANFHRVIDRADLWHLNGDLK